VLRRIPRPHLTDEEHFSLCHQPTTAPDAIIYSQCYCNTFFQAVYQGCVTDCGWGIAGIPPLAAITSTCDSWGTNGPPAAITEAINGGNSGTGQVSTTAEEPAPKETEANGGGSNGNGNGNGNSGGGSSGSGNNGHGGGSKNESSSSVTSGIDVEEDERGLSLRIESFALAGLAVLWVFGWL